MKYSNTVEYIDAINRIVHRNLEILQNAKKEERELTEDESEEMTENEKEVDELKSEKEELEKSLEETPECEKENENRNKNIEKDKMEKKYSLIKELRNAMATGKSIEIRAGEPNYSVTTNGEDLVQTDIYSILEPLRANLVLTKAGAHFMSGLTGDVQVPIMSAGNVSWAGEVAAATDGSGSFTNITLSPKRLTAYFPISLQFLAQDSVDAEAAIRRDIIAAIQDKLEATVLGYAAGSATQPAGLFYDATLTDITTYNDLCDFEADVEEANVNGAMHYIVTPKAKAYLKGLIKGTNNTGMVWDGNAIDGTPAEVTTNLAAASGNKLGVAYGNFNDLYIGAWDTIQLDVVRDSVSLKNGCVTIVVNAFFDAKIARPEAFALGNIVAPTGD
jgi:HK97 family phage major capsid protein